MSVGSSGIFYKNEGKRPKTNANQKSTPENQTLEKSKKTTHTKSKKDAMENENNKLFFLLGVGWRQKKRRKTQQKRTTFVFFLAFSFAFFLTCFSNCIACVFLHVG